MQLLHYCTTCLLSAGESLNVLLRQGRVNGTVYAHCNELCAVFRKFVGSFRSDHDVFRAFRCCLTKNVLCGSAKVYDSWHAYGNALYPEGRKRKLFSCVFDSASRRNAGVAKLYCPAKI